MYHMFTLHVCSTETDGFGVGCPAQGRYRSASESGKLPFLDPLHGVLRVMRKCFPTSRKTLAVFYVIVEYRAMGEGSGLYSNTLV
jgi:hypothetical protein